MNHEVNTLTLRCRGDRSDRARVEQVRGRLARIAEHHLADALDLLLPDVDVVFEKLVAPLDFDLDDYDDETIAWRWAQSIAHATTHAAGSPARSAEPVTAPGTIAVDVAPGRRSATLPEEAALQRDRRLFDLLVAWLERRAPVDLAITQACFARWRDALSTERATTGRAQQPRPVHHLRRVDSLELAASEAEALPGDPHEANTGFVRSQQDRASLVRDLQAASIPDLYQLVELLNDSEELSTEARSALPSLAEMSPVRAKEDVSLVAGICLLYPWLGRFIERAWQTYGERPEVAVAALTSLTPGVDRAFLVGDPLLKVLAGVNPDTPLDNVSIAQLDTRALAEAVDDVHQRFAGSVKGSWVVETMLEQFVMRPGRIEDSGAVWTIFPERRPLDFLLETLPYPLGSFTLAWTQPLAVRWPHE